MEQKKFDEVIKRLQKGGMAILVDDESRENEGDLIIAAEYADANSINFMCKYARGIICLSLHQEYFDKMQIPMQPRRNIDEFSAFFGVSIEARYNITTGVSAEDRAKTISIVLDENSNANDISTPGHMFPLKANSQGVFGRAGHTEGSVDLMKIAGLKKAAVICEIMNEDGTMSRKTDIAKFSKEHEIPVITIEDIKKHRILNENLVVPMSKTSLPSNKYGKLYCTQFYDNSAKKEFVVIHPKSEINKSNPFVRIHSSCFTGDILGSLRCDCGSQLEKSLDIITKNNGFIIYLDQEGRGIGISNKIKAYQLQDEGKNTIEANHELGFAIDMRQYYSAANLLKMLGIKNLRLLTNNPDKLDELQKIGFDIQRVSLIGEVNQYNEKYIKTKRDDLGHVI